MPPHNLVPACDGLEQPFTVDGVRWLYCWDPESGRHCYLNLDTDIPVWDRGFHPAFSPDVVESPPMQQPVGEAPDTDGLVFNW